MLNTPRRSAFTLIELLVVIAILAAILFPVFAQAREKARQIARLSNAKKIGTSVMMYVQDYEETIPPPFIGQGASADNTSSYTPLQIFAVRDGVLAGKKEVCTRWLATGFGSTFTGRFCVAELHARGVNNVFCDGHAKWRKIESMAKNNSRGVGYE